MGTSIRLRAVLTDEEIAEVSRRNPGYRFEQTARWNFLSRQPGERPAGEAVWFRPAPGMEPPDSGTRVSAPMPAPMPRVVGDIDRATREAVARCVRRYGQLPDWHPSVGEVRSVLPAQQLTAKVFRHLDRDTGVLLRGRPDMVFELADGSYHIVDYKSGRKSGRAPQRGRAVTARYRAQLNAYAFLARRAGIGPVSGLSVVYLEAGRLLPAKHGGYAVLAFHAQKRTVSLAPDQVVLPLLRRAAEILRSPGPPEPHRECESCCELVGWAHELLRTTTR